MRSLMAEPPERPRLPDPDLGEPGEPIHATLELEDGLGSPTTFHRPSGTTA
jgi:hypothetical protein